MVIRILQQKSHFMADVDPIKAEPKTNSCFNSELSHTQDDQ